MQAFCPSSFLRPLPQHVLRTTCLSRACRVTTVPSRRVTTMPSRRAVTCEWVERAATITIEAEPSELFVYYSDLKNLSLWSPWIKAVRIDAVDPLLSHWTLNTYGMTLNWKARMTTIEPGARIAWKAEEGLPNRGRVLFTREADDDSRTSVTLAIEFDVPSAVAFAFRSTFVASLVERTLLEDLKRFRDVALGKKRSRVRAGLDVPRRAGPAVQIAIERLAERPA